MTPNTNAIIESSIIIPCGRPERAEASIRSVLKDVVGRNAEIIVVGQGVSMLNERLPSIICIDADRRLSPSQARNRGARSSRGEFLLFLDDDCEVVSGWYDNALHALKTYDQIGAVSGEILGSSNAFFARCTDSTCFWLQQGGELEQTERLYSATLGVRKDVFDSIDGFDENFIVREDVDFVKRLKAAGYTSYYDPAIKVLHDHQRDTLSKLLHYEYNNGLRSGLLESIRHPDRFRDKLKLRMAKHYSVLVLPLASLQVFKAIRRAGLQRSWIVKYLPWMFMAHVSYQLGVLKWTRSSKD